MTNQYGDKDKQFQQKIVSALSERFVINANKEIGNAYFQPETEDKINPIVKISDSEIKKYTGRDKLRNVVLDEYVEALNKYELIQAARVKNDIHVSIEPVRIKENIFSSLRDLEQKNSNEILEEPELGEPQW